MPRKFFLTALLMGSAVSVFYVLLIRLSYLPSPLELPAVLCLNDCSEQRWHTVAPEARSNISLSTIDKSKTSILVEKSKYRLTLYYDKKPVKSYPVVFGNNPVDDKSSEGDRRTPEGIFRIRDLYDHPDWSKFLWLDYPTPQSWRKHLSAKLNGQISLFSTVGSEIGIHGLPQGKDAMIDQRKNWTWGCVSLKNQDVEEIYRVVQVGTIVEIVP
ncbi:L,D-transpeptidase family protein [Leptolyngbya sp. AN03gr2]|uniref:L,D-transpeptidase family protein n=1 Tax=unclassified Leptolyngbya TaxID=2650499 RepID=UPI003D31F5E0